MSADRVDIYRGGEVESRHRVHGVVVGRAPDEEIRFGDPTLLTFWRSSMKPFQALPLVEDGVADAVPLEPEELALCCASHAGGPEHVRGVAGILDRIGLGEEDLGCGPSPPLCREAARQVVRSGGEFGRIHNNCSGKHAGMLALALHHGWPTAGYSDPDHPVQRRIRDGLADWLDVDPAALAWGVDGCGVPTPYLSLRQMARAYARLGRAADGGSSPAADVVDAMRAHPEHVSGEGRPVTRIMEATGGRLVAKEGAEGVLCMAGPSGGWGLALKVSDGGRRATAPAALEMLGQWGLLEPGEDGALSELRRPAIRNTLGADVGEVVPRVEGRAVATAP